MNTNAKQRSARALTCSASDRLINLVITRKRLDKTLLFLSASASVYEGLLSLFLSLLIPKRAYARNPNGSDESEIEGALSSSTFPPFHINLVFIAVVGL